MSNAFVSALAGGSVGPTPTGDAVVADVLAGKTFSNAQATGLEGTMVNNGAVSQTLNAGESYTIPAGYHNGSGTVTAAADTTPVFLGVNERFNSSNAISSYTDGTAYVDNGVQFVNVVGKSSISYTNSTGNATGVIGFKNSVAGHGR